MDYTFAYRIKNKLKNAAGYIFAGISKFHRYVIIIKNRLAGLTILQFASFSYIPFAGWAIPLLLKKDNLFCIHHAKQGFIVAFAFIFTLILLNIINIFVPKEWQEFRLSIVIVIYFVYISYLIISITAIYKVLKGKEFNIRIIKRLVDSIEL